MKQLSRRSMLLGTVAALPLAGCVTIPGPLPVDINSVIARAQQIAQTICAFVPTAATIGGIISTFLAQFAAIEQLAAASAQAFCNAIHSAQAKGARPRRLARGNRTSKPVVDFGVEYVNGQPIALQAYLPG